MVRTLSRSIAARFEHYFLCSFDVELQKVNKVNSKFAHRRTDRHGAYPRLAAFDYLESSLEMDFRSPQANFAVLFPKRRFYRNNVLIRGDISKEGGKVGGLGFYCNDYRPWIKPGKSNTRHPDVGRLHPQSRAG